MFVRNPVFAGTFYPEKKEEIKSLIDRLFAQGPKKTPYKISPGKKILGVISPHAGYAYSGRTAAYAYYELSKTRPKTVVIIGPNHSGLGNNEISLLDFGSYKTPLGDVAIDSDAAKVIIENSNAASDFLAHSQEHSIEVQLPFLQYIYEGHDFKIVPIVLSSPSLSELERLAGAIRKLSDYAVVVSSDFTHYGRSYGYTPFKKATKEALFEHDSRAIDFIMHRDARAFYEASKNTTICGKDGIVVLTLLARELNAKPKFLNYSTSAETSSDYENIVGYASLSFEMK